MRKTILSFLMITLFFVGCRKEKFSSDSKWLAPVLETELTLGDLVPDSLLSANSDNSLNLVFEEEYGITNLEDILKIPDRVDSLEVTLSSLVLDDRSFEDTLTLGELYPPANLLHGKEASVPAQDLEPNQGTEIDVSEEFFSTATFIEGYIDITITNELPMEAELLEFQLINANNDEIVITGTFENMAPNSTVSKSYSLAGKTVNGVLELKVTKIKTKATGGEVTIDATKGLIVSLGVRDLKPSYAKAVFPAQNLLERFDEKKYEFGGAELTKVEVKSGFIRMRVQSSIEEAIILDYLIPNSESVRDGPPVRRKWTVPAAKPGQTVYLNEEFSIAGSEIFLWGETNSEAPLTNHVYSELIAKIAYSGIERTLSLTDKIKIEFGLVDVVPKLVFGDPGYHELNLGDTTKLTIFKNVEGNLSLEDATLEMLFVNSFGIDSEIDIKSLKGVNNRKPNTVVLSAEQLSAPIFLEKVSNSSTTTPIEKSILVDKTNSNLKQFLENMPDELHAEIIGKVRPKGTINLSDFAYDFSELIVNLRIDVPMQVGMDGLTLKSKSSINLFANEQIEGVREAALRITAFNNFPIQAKIELEFLDGSGNVLTTLFADGNSTVAAAEVDPITEKTAAAVESSLETTVTRPQMVLLKNATDVNVKVTLDTKDNTRYKLFSDYGIKVQLSTEVVYENKL
jgi:hypothetical protein